MGAISRTLRQLSPHALLRLYMAVVVGVAALAIGAVLWTTSTVDSRTRDAASTANAAAAAAQVQAGLRDPLILLLLNTTGFILSDDGLAGLPEEERARVLALVGAGFIGLTPPPSAFPDISLPMSEREGLGLHRSVELSSAQIDELVLGADEIDLMGVTERRDALSASLDAYLANDSVGNYADLIKEVLALGDELDAVEDQLSLGVTRTQADLSRATSQARLVMLVALVFLTAMMGLATLLVGRLINSAFRSSENQRKAQQEASQTLRYRNDQLNALYAVFSEITDTLSMHHVINATLRETLRVMKGSMATLRLLKDGELVPVGNLTSDGKAIADLPVLSLGEGMTGRVARRGRSMRIGKSGQERLASTPQPDDPGSKAKSGVVSPLVVGARVIGTLAVWSEAADAFTEEDEHVLEMMASQVATAIVAADNAETSERRALQDPLTGLPNRRQLSMDMGKHRRSLDNGGMAAVAMVDVDKFKYVNDEFGHSVGDVSLQKIASVLRSAMRDGDVIYRYGGEEFLAIFNDASAQDALVAAERLRRAVESTQITGAAPITVSIGIALMPEHGTDVSHLIEKADRAMYQAKDLGRNRVKVWEEEASKQDITAVA